MFVTATDIFPTFGKYYHFVVNGSSRMSKIEKKLSKPLVGFFFSTKRFRPFGLQSLRLAAANINQSYNFQKTIE
jgi:hypothetical protein